MMRESRFYLKHFNYPRDVIKISSMASEVECKNMISLLHRDFNSLKLITFDYTPPTIIMINFN